MLRRVLLPRCNIGVQSIIVISTSSANTDADFDEKIFSDINDDVNDVNDERNIISTANKDDEDNGALVKAFKKDDCGQMSYLAHHRVLYKKRGRYIFHIIIINLFPTSLSLSFFL